MCVFARVIYTGTSAVNESYLNFRGNTIVGISSTAEGEIQGRYDVITPALIDSHAHIGLARAAEPTREAEFSEQCDSITAAADALDSIQMDDQSFVRSCRAGVLYSCVLPGSMNLIAGRCPVIRNFAGHGAQAFVAQAGIKAALGYNPTAARDWKGQRPSTRMGALAHLRRSLSGVCEKLSANGTLTASEQVLAAIITRRETLRVHVHKADDIDALLRLVDEFRVRVIVEHAGATDDVSLFRELRRRDIAVNYGPVDSFAYKVELKRKSWRNIAHLLESGVRYGLMSDHPVSSQRMLLFQLRWFIRCGLDKSEAIGVITNKNAAILGISDKLGRLTRSKWASFVCWNGDPFDVTHHPVAVYAEGALIAAE